MQEIKELFDLIILLELESERDPKRKDNINELAFRIKQKQKDIFYLLDVKLESKDIEEC